MILNDQATSDRVITELGQAAQQLDAGDMLFLTYSGHGGQVPDLTGENSNGLDDTWVLYDRMVLGHELYAAVAASAR